MYGREAILCNECGEMESKGIIAGQGFTKRDCEWCGKTEQYHSTYTDALCSDCSLPSATCKHCGKRRVTMRAGATNE